MFSKKHVIFIALCSLNLMVSASSQEAESEKSSYVLNLIVAATSQAAQRGNLSCEVLVKLSSEGKVEHVAIQKSSQNSEVDMHACKIAEEIQFSKEKYCKACMIKILFP